MSVRRTVVKRPEVVERLRRGQPLYSTRQHVWFDDGSHGDKTVRRDTLQSLSHNGVIEMVGNDCGRDVWRLTGSIPFEFTPGTTEDIEVVG